MVSNTYLHKLKKLDFYIVHYVFFTFFERKELENPKGHSKLVFFVSAIAISHAT